MIKEVDVNEIRFLWKKLWPRGFECLSSRTYMDGYDPLYNKSKLICLGYFYENKIVGVNSIFKTGKSYRSRGLYVLKEYRSRGIAFKLLKSSIIISKDLKAKFIWSMPRISALNVYEKAGFNKSSDFFEKGVDYGPHCYVIKKF